MLRRMIIVMTLAASFLTTAHAFAQERPPLEKLRAVPFTDVRIDDAFWSPRRKVNREVSLQHSLKMLEDTGAIRNFDRAAAGQREGFEGLVYTDSDLYKTLESVAYALATDPDPQLDAQLDAIIARIAAAQMDDGYLNTWYQINAPDKRFSNLRDHHEIYCAGHLIEAAVAHYQATGKSNLLRIARRYADCMERTFGKPPRRGGYCGHPEVELALVKLWHITGEQRYFDLAKFFLDSRGSGFFATEHNTPADKYDGRYWQDNCPIREHDSVTGHAVRFAYLMSAAVDVGVETDDAGMLDMIDRVWRNTTERNMYVTGGIGSSARNEGFTTDYDLPNRTAYQETCASVAMAMWNHRLNLAYGDAKYAELMELALYNGALAGFSLDGTKFFYVNPLESVGTHHRRDWYACACCPPNVTRTLAALGNYAYAVSDDSLYVNLYVQGGVLTNVTSEEVELDVKTDYPWSGRVEFTFKRDADIFLRLRMPSWCDAGAASVHINDQKIANAPIDRGYIVLDRSWKRGDRIALDLPMPVRRIESHPNVIANRGHLALARGPLIYCIEGVDIPDAKPFWSFAIAADAPIATEKRDDLLEGMVALKGEAIVAGSPSPIGRGVGGEGGDSREGLDRGDGGAEWQDDAALYRTAPSPRRVPFRAIPYCLWDHRGPTPMRVWLPTALPAPAPPRGPEATAKVTLSWTSHICDPEAIRDGIEPKDSYDHPGNLCHWWPHKGDGGGGTEWVAYSWEKPVLVGGLRVYWFDDTGRGECRLPKSWRVLYRSSAEGEWLEAPVSAAGASASSPAQKFPVAKDRWCEVTFAQPIEARELRLEFQMQEGWSAGIHEWKVTAAK